MHNPNLVKLFASRQRLGFTFIEVMAVVIIIAILSAIGLGVFRSMEDFGAKRITESTLQNLKLIEEEHFNITGERLHTSTSPFIRKTRKIEALRQLYAKFDDQRVLIYNNNYTSGGEQNFQVIDGWSQRIQYYSIPGNRNGSPYRHYMRGDQRYYFCSPGPDREFGHINPPSFSAEQKQLMKQQLEDNMYSFDIAGQSKGKQTR